MLPLYALGFLPTPEEQLIVPEASIEGAGTLTLDDSFQVFFEGGRLGIRYLDEAAAAGRQDRSIPLDALDNLRVLVDGSAVEVFANDGAEVFASRWFCPEKESLVIASTFAHGGSIWSMKDVMGKEYAFAREMGLAPDLAMPGWNETIPH
jgi:beta-fructofuranosidase